MISCVAYSPNVMESLDSTIRLSNMEIKTSLGGVLEEMA